MNAASARRIVAQIVIVACLAGGAWHLGLRPMEARLARAQASLQAQRAEVARLEADQGTAPTDPRTRAGLVEAREARLNELSRRSGDTAGLYDLIGDLAVRSGVRVQRIEPKGATQPIKDKEHDPVYAVMGVQYSIEAAGDYGHIAEFVRLIEQDAGLTKVVSIRLAPTPATVDQPDPTTVTASIETSHLRLVIDTADTGKTPQPLGGHR